MQNQVDAVREFHLKYGFQVDETLEPASLLGRTARLLTALSQDLRTDWTVNELRLHLVVEEVAELAEALVAGSRQDTLDALVDLVYVAVGTAVTFGLPLAAGFKEVHRSNMTKTVARDRGGHPGKGKGYFPPDLQKILDEMKENN